MNNAADKSKKKSLNPILFGILAFVLICGAMIFNVLREICATKLFPPAYKVAFNKGYDRAKENRAEGIKMMEAALADGDKVKNDAETRGNLYYKYGCWNFNEHGLPQRFGRAKTAFAKCVNISSDITIKAMALGLMSDCDYYSGVVADGEKNVEQAWAYRNSGACNDPLSMLCTMAAMGRAYMNAGHYDKAVKTWSDALSLAKKTNDQRADYVDVSTQLACAYAASGDREHGDAQFVDSLKYSDEHGGIGNRGSEEAIIDYTRVLQKCGDTQSAQKLATRLDNPSELSETGPRWTAIGW
jgi:tetratricopeptide (TPR) repeat protein